MPSVQLDPRTLIFILTLVQIARAIALLHVRQTHKQYAPAGYWAFGSLLTALGFLLVAFRDLIPLWLSVVLANALILPGWMLVAFGIVLATEHKPPWRLGIAVTIIACIVISWNAVLQPEYTYRLITFNLAVILFDGYAAYHCLRHSRNDSSMTYKILGICQLLIMLSCFWRTLDGCCQGISSLLSPTLAQLQFSIVFIFFSFISTIMMVLLTSDKLRNEIEEISRQLLKQRELERDFAHLNAITDSLTGLANRRRFDEGLNTEFYRLKRSGVPLSLIMIDIDHFKKYNDTYGHPAGDDCLKQVATAIKKLIGRSPDLVARYGGEEFAVILPETKRRGAQELAERIRQGVEALLIPHRTSTTAPHVTISLGLATATTSTMAAPEHIVALADEALYQAKQKGRNRLETAAETPATKKQDGSAEHGFVHLVWRPTYESGNPTVDAQHRDLFANSNILLSALLEGRSKEGCSTLIDNLLQDITHHFQTEETFFRQNEYPFADDHCHCHRELLAQAKIIAAKYQGDELTLGDLFNFIAYDVIAKHMFIEDRKLFAFL